MKPISQISLMGIFIMLLLCYNCKTAEPSVKGIVSEKPICLVQDFATGDQESIVLLLPLEFELNLNHKQVKDVGIYFYLDNKVRLVRPDYLVYNSKTDRPIFAIEDLNYPNYPARIYLLNRTLIISKEAARKLIKKYNPTAKVEDIKTRQDTITLTSYKQFREDAHKFINYLREEPDGVEFAIRLEGKKDRKLLKTTVNW